MNQKYGKTITIERGSNPAYSIAELHNKLKNLKDEYERKHQHTNIWMSGIIASIITIVCVSLAIMYKNKAPTIQIRHPKITI